MTKTYNLEITERAERHEVSVYPNLHKDELEKMISGLYKTQLAQDVLELSITDSNDEEVKYRIYVGIHIVEPGSVNIPQLPPVDPIREAGIDAIVKKYWDEQPKTILKKTIPTSELNWISVKPMTEGNNKGGGQNPPPKGPKPNNPPPSRNPRK